MDVVEGRRLRQGLKLLPRERYGLLDQAADLELPVRGIDLGDGAVVEDGPAFRELLAGGQALAVLFAVFVASGEQIHSPLIIQSPAQACG